MKLQVALDCATVEEALDILKDVHEYVDIAEIGTVGMYNGFDAIDAIREAYPRLEILADLKIPDGGYGCSKAAFARGADYVTVMGVVDDPTVMGGVRAANEAGKEIVIDMIGCRNFAERAKEVDAMGVHIIAVHTAVDTQREAGGTPFEQLELARVVVKNAKISVAGGVSLENLPLILPFKPDIVISGAGLTKAPDRRATAKAMKEAMEA